MYFLCLERSDRSHRSRATQGWIIHQSWGRMKVSIHQKRNEKRTGERTESKRSPSRARRLPSFLLCAHIGHSFGWTNVCIYHLFKDRCTLDEQTERECFSVYPPPGESRSVEKELLRSDDGSAGVDGNWGKASTARKERRSSTSGSRNQVVARNLLVLSCRDFEETYTGSRKKIYLNSLLPAKDNKIILGGNLQSSHVWKYIFVVVHRSNDIFLSKSVLIYLLEHVSDRFQIECFWLNLICKIKEALR